MKPRTEPGRIFDELNRKYWDGKLPRFRVVYGRIPTHVKDEDEGMAGVCIHETRTIKIDAGLTTPQPNWDHPDDPPDPNDADEIEYLERLRLLLLHEMCHIGDPRGHHDGRFLRKMRRLIRLGATGLTEEADCLAATLAHPDNARALRQSLSDIAEAETLVWRLIDAGFVFTVTEPGTVRVRPKPWGAPAARLRQLDRYVVKIVRARQRADYREAARAKEQGAA